MATDGFSLPEAKADATYLNDDTVLFSTALDGATSSGYARIVKRWQRGQPLAAAKTLYQGDVADVGSSATAFHTKDGDYALVVRSVSFFETDYFAIEGDGVKKLAIPRSADLRGMIAGTLVAVLREDYQGFRKGALVAFREGQKPQLIYQPGPRGSIETVSAGRDKLYVAITDNVIGAVHAFTTDGNSWTDEKLALPGQGAADIVSVNEFGPQAMFRFENYITPTTLLFLMPATISPKRSNPCRRASDASGIVTEQFFATAQKTAPKFPISSQGRKASPARRRRCCMPMAASRISMTPAYSANFGRLWLSHGGVYVVANISGGGEFGPAWHEAALKTHRQRAYDDFEAVAADLLKRGLTTPKQFGIMGGSNGGLLVSTVMTQIPDELAAVVCQVPLIDMIAYTHIGAGASWIGEYGDPADPKMRDYILTYSPYQNVKPGVKYPPVFFVTATSDDRVTPVHARKMAAKMEAMGQDVLFYENTDGGHAAAADHKQKAEMWALSFVYLAQKLGLK